MIGVAAQEKITASSDRARFESLMHCTHRQAYSLAYRLTGNASEAEDLVQETFLRAYRFFAKYDASLPFTSWLYRIMTNAHIDSVRRRGRLRTMSLDQAGPEGSSTWDLPDLEASPDRAMMESTLDENVQTALTCMTAEFRTAVLLADVEGMAYEEIAEIMKTSVGTVRSRIHRGRKQLKRFMVQHCAQSIRRISNEL